MSAQCWRSRFQRWFGIGRRTFLLAEVDHLLAANAAVLRRLDRRRGREEPAEPDAASDELRASLVRQLQELARFRGKAARRAPARPAERLTDVLDRASRSVEVRLGRWMERLRPRQRYP